MALSYSDCSGNASNLAFEWRHRVTENSDLRLTTYYDFMSRPEPAIPVEQTRTGDFELQYHYAAGRHDVSAGLADRLISEKVIGTGPMVFNPLQVGYQLASGFAQDEIHFLNDRLLVTLGGKIEHAMFGGWQLQPTARALWAPDNRHSAWLSISRAARTPAFYERDLTALAGPPSPGPMGLPMVVTINGSPLFQSEILKGYELGYRAQPSLRVAIDIAGFYNDYHSLSTQNAAPPTIVGGPQPYLVVPFVLTNNATAVAVGGEVAMTYQPFSRWKVSGSYSYLNLSRHLREGATPDTQITARNATPGNQWKLQSFLNLSRTVQFDSFVYSSTSILTRGLYGQLIPPHTRIDVRLGWRVTPRFEASLCGQDLLSPRHVELTPEAMSPPTDAVRGYYLKTTWRF